MFLQKLTKSLVKILQKKKEKGIEGDRIGYNRMEWERRMEGGLEGGGEGEGKGRKAKAGKRKKKKKKDKLNNILHRRDRSAAVQKDETGEKEGEGVLGA